MDPVKGPPLGDWLSNKSTRRQSDSRPEAPRHVRTEALTPRSAAAWPISHGVLASLQRSTALTQNAAWGYAYGRSDRILTAARSAAGRHWNFNAPADAVETILREVIEGELTDATRRSVVAALAQHVPRTLDRSLPRSILQLYPRAMGVLGNFLESGPSYDADLFAKDIRFICGASAPAGAQSVDVLFSSSPLAQLGRLRRGAGTTGRLLVAGDARRAANFLTSGGLRSWLQIHTDTRDISEFNPQGWDRCYHRIADLLRARSHMAGMLGISWFYDPQLREISPRLSYLQDGPLQNGAFLVRLAASPLDAERAGAASPTRRRLIESGAYTPVCHALFWPRRDLLRWAGRVERETFEPKSLRHADAA